MQEITYFRAYLYTMLRNHLYNALRKIVNEEAVIRELGHQQAGETSVIDTLHRKQLLDKLHQAVAQLTPQQKRVFELGKLQGLKHEEIAEQMKISPETNSKPSKNRELLRPYFEQENIG